MIGQNSMQIATDGSKAKTAIRDAIVVFIFALVSGLIAAGYPPTMQVLYTSGIAGVFMGITSYMYALGIKKPDVIQ
jgi:hypothetical protein